MAVKKEDPNQTIANLNDWRILIERTTFQGSGYMLVDWCGKQTTDIPVILKGSRIELNNSFYEVKKNEIINGWDNISDNTWCYVYLKAFLNGTAEFNWSTTKPTFQIEKGGWFHPVNNNERAILSARKVSRDICRAKTLIGVSGKQFPVPTDQSGTTINVTTGVINNIEAGWYRLSLTGGKGGKGGNGGSNGTFRTVLDKDSPTVSYINGRAGSPGLQGKEGNSKTFYVWLEEGTLEVRPGKTGNDGSAGSTGGSGDTTDTSTVKGCGSGGNGGRGANGEETAVLNNGKLVAVVSGGIGGSGGMGEPGHIGNYRIGKQTGDSTFVYSLGVGTPPVRGANGADGDGFSTVSGSVTVSVL
jgi:hypothetical protein